MKKNIGKTDKMIRIILAIILVSLDFFRVVDSPYAWILTLLGIVLAGSTLISFCPLYTIFGINTNKSDNS